MNTSRLITIAAAVLAVSSAATAFADEAGYVEAHSTASRASVVAERQRAQAAGELSRTDADYGQFVAATAAPSTSTRAQVQAEAMRASATAEIRNRGQAFAVFTPMELRNSGTVSREAVKAEARTAAAKRTFDVSSIGG